MKRKRLTQALFNKMPDKVIEARTDRRGFLYFRTENSILEDGGLSTFWDDGYKPNDKWVRGGMKRKQAEGSTFITNGKYYLLVQKSKGGKNCRHCAMFRSEKCSYKGITFNCSDGMVLMKIRGK